MDSRYDEFMRRQKLVQQLSRAQTDTEKGIALLDLACDMFGLSRTEVLLHHPELREFICPGPAVPLADRKRA
ncbi:MAG: hypothetical protein ACEQSB_02015 [Undibacterium sp.]